MDHCLSLLVILLMCSPGWSYPPYADKIPNGKNVKHPCKDALWLPVGHIDPTNAKDRNIFGMEFSTIGNHKWTKQLCMRDSDGDGVSNGDELGDPNCVWSVGQTPAFTTGITHPGVCEPVESAFCQQKNSFSPCALPEPLQNCNVINEADIMTKELRIPETKVPGVETTYICMTFDLPNDDDYHIVAFEPIVGNTDVIHHMLLYGCAQDTVVDIPTPGSCDMPASDKSCFALMTTWTVGVPGRCYGSDVGFRIGKSGIQRMRLELHWNNPTFAKDFTDTSGIKIYFRPVKPGVQDLAVFATGQTFLEIPPGKHEVSFSGTCQGYCTASIMKQKVYVKDVLNHMHFMGKSMKVEVYRHGKWIKDLSNDHHYDYNYPVFHEHNPPFELLPGDEIKTTCSFSSLNFKRWVYFGEGTSDEMCFGILLLYPKQALNGEGWCMSSGPLSSCDWALGKWVGDCDWARFVDFEHVDNKDMYALLTQNCNVEGFCRPECREYTEKLKQHPCLRGDAFRVVRRLYGLTKTGSRALARINSCSGGRHPDGLDLMYNATARPTLDCTDQCSDICAEVKVQGDGAVRNQQLAWASLTVVVLAMTLY